MKSTLSRSLSVAALVTSLVLGACAGDAGETTTTGVTESTQPDDATTTTEPTTTTSSGVSQPTPNAIKIGIVQAFTGPIAAIGFKKLDGAQFFIEQVNAAGGINGIPVSIVKRDSASDPAVAVQQVRDLADDPEVLAIIGPTSSGAHLATKPVTAELGIVQVGAVSAAALSEPPVDWWFRAYPADVLQNSGALLFLQDQGVETMALITADDAFGASAATNFRNLAGDYGIEIVADEVYSPETTDPTIQIAKAIQAQPDAYVMWDGTNPARLALAVQSARLQGVEEEIIMLPEGASGSAFLEAAGEAAEGTYFFSQFSGDDPLPGPQTEFVSDFVQAFNRVPDQEILGYIEAQIVVRAIELALESDSGLTRESLRDAIEMIAAYETAIGPISFGPDKHDPQEATDVQINQYQDGKRVRVSR